jgi:hypothetical protein
MLATKGTRVRKEMLERLEAGTYLTDGRRLLRVVGGFADPGVHGLALLEDCRTLEKHAVSADQLCRLELELVRPPAPAR